MNRPHRTRVWIAALTLAILSAFPGVCLCAETDAVAEPTFKPQPPLLESRGCTITKVSIAASVVYIEFTGHWNHYQDFFAGHDVDRNGVSFIVNRESNPPLLGTIGPEAQKLIGKKANIVILLKHAGVTSRGGIPLVFLPEDASDVKITAAR